MLTIYVYYYLIRLLIYLSYVQRDNSLTGVLLSVLNPCRFPSVECMYIVCCVTIPQGRYCVTVGDMALCQIRNFTRKVYIVPSTYSIL